MNEPRKILARWDISSTILVGKVKAIPLEAWTGPEGSRKTRPPYFITIGT
jgi:hypothetical protein